jgi:hypothetical protein
MRSARGDDDMRPPALDADGAALLPGSPPSSPGARAAALWSVPPTPTAAAATAAAAAATAARQTSGDSADGGRGSPLEMAAPGPGADAELARSSRRAHGAAPWSLEALASSVGDALMRRG